MCTSVAKYIMIVNSISLTTGSYLHVSLPAGDQRANVVKGHFPEYLVEQHRSGNTRSAKITSPKVLVQVSSCLKFYVFLENTKDSGMLVESSSGLEWWINGNDIRTWREV